MKERQYTFLNQQETLSTAEKHSFHASKNPDQTTTEKDEKFVSSSDPTLPTNNKQDMAEERQFSQLIQQLSNTTLVHKIAGQLFPKLIQTWAGKNIFKKIVAAPLKKSIHKSFQTPIHTQDLQEVSAILMDPENGLYLGQKLPLLVNHISVAALGITKSIQTLPQKEKIDFIHKIWNNIDFSNFNALFKQWMQLLQEIHQSEPQFLAQKLENPLRKFMEELDFAEVKETLDQSAADLVAIIRMASNTLWEYPAKVICLLSLMPTLTNVMLEGGKEFLKPVNELSPDLIADVVLSLFSEVQGEKVGALINEINELIRKLHIGSSLIGEPHLPHFPVVLSQKFKEINQSLDHKLLFKVKTILAEDKAAVNAVVLKELEENPAFIQDYLIHLTKIKNTGIRTTRKKAEMLVDLSLQNSQTNEAIDKSLSQLELQEAAETVNHIMAIITKIKADKPDLLHKALLDFFCYLDEDLLQETIEIAVDELIKAIQPLSSVLLPPMIKGFCRLMNPNQPYYDSEMEAAMNDLRKLLSNE